MPPEDLSPEVLSKVLLIQNMLPTLADLDEMLSFTCRGLEDLPGVDSVRYARADNGESPTRGEEPGFVTFRVHIGDTTYASISFCVTDEWEFLRYHPYVSNICFMIASRLEDQRHRKLGKEYQRQLELEVELRTTDLRAARLQADTQRARAEMYLDTAEAIIVELDRDGIIERINLRGAELLGYPPESLPGQDWFGLAVPQHSRESRRHEHAEAMNERTCIEEYGDREIVTAMEEFRVVHWHTIIRRNDNGTIVGTLSSGQDVSERHKSEREKEVLLKEVYHRTKNNMQVITSLLSLQAAETKDANVQAFMRDAQSRIMSMALVHNMLYSSADITHLPLKDYITQLAGNLLAGYSAGERRIALEVTGENVPVTLETAIPCGLVMNEILTNSIKHAFGESDLVPRITVAVDRLSEKVVVRYRDNGRGLPPDYSSTETSGLGMQIIRNVVTVQLGGTIEIVGNRGVEITIQFPQKDIVS